MSGKIFYVLSLARSSGTPELSGVGLPTNYKFAQVHFHWGSDSSAGKLENISRLIKALE